MNLQHDQPSQQPDPEFIELVQRVIDHEASLDDVALLNATLPNDPVALRHFVKMRVLHGALEHEFGNQSNALDSIDKRVATYPASGGTKARWGLKQWSLAAALVLLASLAGIWGTDKILHRPAFEVLARSGQFDAAAPANGSWLGRGERLSLGNASVDLRAADGTALTFQGPGELVIQGERKLTLNSGKLWAVVNGSSILVQTPNGQITDLGTTFGIDQSMAGSTRIDVFEGRVSLSDPTDSTRNVEADAGSGLSREAMEWPPVKHKADALRYQAGLRQPVGLVFIKDEAERSIIGSALPMKAGWTPVSAHSGKIKPNGASFEIAWSGSSLFKTGAGDSPQAALFTTHLEGWAEGPQSLKAKKRELALPDEDAFGIVVQLRGMSAWLNEIGAQSYRVTLLRNSSVPNVNFLPVTVYEGVPDESNDGTLHKLWIEDYLPADYPDDTGGTGARAVENLKGPFAADVLTLTLPGQAEREHVNRGNVSAVLVTPEFSSR